MDDLNTRLLKVRYVFVIVLPFVFQEIVQHSDFSSDWMFGDQIQTVVAFYYYTVGAQNLNA